MYKIHPQELLTILLSMRSSDWTERTLNLTETYLHNN